MLKFIEKFLQKNEKNTCIFRKGVLIYRSRRETATRTKKDPGVAKFGIALEWGSRGLEFESRHSDQKPETALVVSGFFFTISATGLISVQRH